MKGKYTGYYELLKEEVNGFEDAEPYIYLLPDFFKLLCDLLDTQVGKDDRVRISCALANFVSPGDIIPEEVYRPSGYVDDIFLSCYVLDMIRSNYGIGIMEPYWEREEDLGTALDDALKRSTAVIEEHDLKDEILTYVGLK